MTKLIALHGYTSNGAVMRKQLGSLVAELEREVELVFLDAPHECTPESVDALYAIWQVPREAPPHLAWWETMQEGREYRGWEATEERLRETMAGGDVAFLGFSQGAILATVIAALAQHGKMPPVRYAVLIAGRTPRVDFVQPFLGEPLRTPSLHMCGADDTMAGPFTTDLASRFDEKTREVVTFEGAHEVPANRDGRDPILRFVREHRT